MFTRILTSALFAGASAGLVAALLQLYFVQPVLLHAELYEGGDLVHFGSEVVSSSPELPGFDAVRDGLSIVFSMMIYAGYAMVLIAGMVFAEERGAKIDARTGIIWGIAGFIAFHLAPGFSLAPETPGSAAADIEARQIWWWATVVTAAIALWLIAFGKNWMAWGAAVVLLLAPHVVGAPQPEAFASPTPSEIGSLFSSRALGTGLASWAILGCLAGYFWQREKDRADS